MLKFVENILRAYNYGISTNIDKYLADNLIGRFWNTSNINYFLETLINELANRPE